MSNDNGERILIGITLDDVQTIAKDSNLKRELTKDELDTFERKFELINWADDVADFIQIRFVECEK